jgi:hypothetical protein
MQVKTKTDAGLRRNSFGPPKNTDNHRAAPSYFARLRRCFPKGQSEQRNSIAIGFREVLRMRRLVHRSSSITGSGNGKTRELEKGIGRTRSHHPDATVEGIPHLAGRGPAPAKQINNWFLAIMKPDNEPHGRDRQRI